MIRDSLAILMTAAIVMLTPVPGAAQEPKLELKQGDTICIVGNTLAERMQHDGWLEATIQQRFPDRQLTFRNLGFSADTLSTRLRSKDFGTPDQWLARCEADVVFAFFGYNESFAGEEGLPQFRRELDDFVKHTLEQTYNGESAPTLVLFSPTARENLNEKSAVMEGAVGGLETVNQNVPDGRGHEEHLWSYTQAMQEVARDNSVLFVDLLAPTSLVFNIGKDDTQHTINGVHLNELGNMAVALEIDAELFGRRDDAPEINKDLRSAVIDKNWHWFHRYRTTDGFSTYGGRADLKFTDGQTNREVVQRELEVLDYMTAERDKKIQAIASGNEFTVDDSGHPPLIPVISNKPGEGPNGAHLFLSGEEAIDKMTVHEGMQVNLFASEEQFPELASPVQMSFDPNGRLWVAVWPTYPHWQPIVEQMNDKLLIFKDTDGDGRADDMTVFADKLHNPTGFEFWNGGVLVAQAPDIWFLKDTDGDDVADLRMRVLHGIDSADTHHTANSFTYGPDGAIYFQEGTFHHSQIESPWGPPLRLVNAGVFRFEPRTSKIEAYVSYPFANPHGHVFDHWGQDFVTDGTGNVNYYAAPFSGHVNYPDKHRNYFPFFQQWVRPSGATELLSSAHFPEPFQGNYLIANVIGFQGLLHYEVHEDDSGFSATEVTPILSSTDPNFRPVDIEMGPDGAIYFVDWQNPIIGHMQHNLRDPNRDKTHGRVYRVTWKEGELSTPTDLTQLSEDQLLDQLKSPVTRVRYRTRLELSGRQTGKVLPAVEAWVAALDPSDAEYQHHLLEALWVTQQHNRVDEDLLKQMLRSPEPRARAAATRVLCYCRDQVADPLPLLQQQINDEFPRVRLEAVRALSFLPSVEAAEIALEVLNYPRDKFIDYCLAETLRVHAPLWKPHVASGDSFADDNPQGLRYIVADMSPAELTGMRRSQTVFEELLKREGILHEFRHEAAEGLAGINGTDANIELLTAIARLDQSDAANAQSVLADLTHIFLHGDGSNVHGEGSQVDFSQYRDQLDELATSARRENTRQVAYATLIAAEKSADRLWQQTLVSNERFRDFVNALALVDDEDVKKQLEPKVAELLLGLPMEMEQQIDSAKVTNGRYVRIELPGARRTLTLAEVEVMSGGRNVAPSGTATQSSTNHGGKPELAMDGNKSPIFSDRGQTHTRENQPNPWWELDLGTSHGLDAIVVWNRNENNDMGKRLDGFTIKILDADRNVVFEQTDIGAPDSSVTIPLEGDPRGAIREATINAAVHLLSGEQATFEAFAKFILDNQSRAAAVRGMARLPRRSWQDQAIRPLVDNIISTVSALPAAERTEPHVVDEISLGKKLATALPGDQAKQARSTLNDLGINVIVLRPIRHRMQYDRSHFFVEAGKPFQLIFDNTDIMPHNIVITRPGAYAKVGIAAELMATEPDALKRGYVPNMPEVMHASKLLQPGQLQRMDLVAPDKPGEYPYVCTYPGHWRRMYGTMHVIEDLDNAPVEALVPTVDSEIAARPFVREWTVQDLLKDLDEADQARSWERGRALFTELSCAQCHKMGDSEGGDVGPNLVDLQQKLSTGNLDREGLLKSLIDPSADIEERYVSWIIQDIDGRLHTGVVAERSDTEIRILANPLDNEKPVTILIDDIEDEMKSKISMMPQGVLNTCSKQEILDLLIYVEAAGDREHPAFGER